GPLFMPVATRLNLSAECDMRAIDLAVAWIKSNCSDLAIRVSLASLVQSRIWAALQLRLDALESEPDVSRHLAFELDAHGLVECPEEFAQFCRVAKKVGATIGVRRIDAEPSA